MYITDHSSGYLAVLLNLDTILDFFCIGVMYSGEHDACDVTGSVYPHRVSLKNMPCHGGNRTYNLWNTTGHFLRICQWAGHLQKGTILY